MVSDVGDAVDRSPVTPARPAGEGVPLFLPRARLGELIDALRSDGRTVIGPTLREGAIELGEIEGVADLPFGWSSEQSPGHYRLVDAEPATTFAAGVGASSAKRWTFPPAVPILRATRTPDGQTTFGAIPADVARVAFLGLRACDVAALAVQDRVLFGRPFVDEDYRARRRDQLVVAVECTTAQPTCFCTSMGTGPAVRAPFDLALTELADGFVVRVGSRAGEAVAARVRMRDATVEERQAALAGVAAAATEIGNPIATDGLAERLVASHDSPRWAEIAERCLSCANCTLVCPTCFCTSVVQRSDLIGADSVSERTWDSCFTPGFARVAGGSFRSRPQDRYRQWLTHKFATWVEQFGSFGCVGCGRCIAWCPVGIDVREELAAIAPPLEQRHAAIERPIAAGSPARLTVARLRERRVETADVATLVLDGLDEALLRTRPGQFVMVELPAFPPLPISVSRVGEDAVELTIRSVGPATEALVALRVGAEVGLRGPLGRPWPLERAIGRDVVVVTGGIGLAPLRPLLDALVADRERFGALRLYDGARTPEDLLYRDEIERWAADGSLDVALTVDRAGPRWSGPVGVVTHLFDRETWDGSRAIAFVCGPERMMQATADTLAERGIGRDRTWVTLERHMECGLGLCGHCQLGPWFVCRDGPVFSLAELGDAFGREGL